MTGLSRRRLLGVLFVSVLVAGCGEAAGRYAAWFPDPYVGSIIDPLGVVLTWVGNRPAQADSAQFRVFLDGEDPPRRVACPVTVDEDCRGFDLGFERTYYWQVETRFGSDTVRGPVWVFTTDRCTSAGWCPTEYEKQHLDNYESGYPIYGT